MKNKLYFLCPNNEHATGGVKQIYRQVETLRKNGFDAYILHKKQGKKDRWFNINVPIVYSPYLFKKLKHLYNEKQIGFLEKIEMFFLKQSSIKLESDSILIIPEVYGPHIHKIEPNVKKVIFNQNCYYTFGYYSMYKEYLVNPYNDNNTIATIVASDDAEKYLNYCFPNITVYKMRLGIDDSIFNFAKNKKKQICVMPRKLGDDVNQVIQIIKQRNLYKDWDIVFVDNKSELEVANIMKDSLIFLSFNYKEGFGLPPVEAMSCGCYVIGYKGQAGKEYFKQEFSYPINDGDIIQFVKAIEETVNIYENKPEEIITKGELASEFVRNNYSLKNEEDDIIKIWSKIL